MSVEFYTQVSDKPVHALRWVRKAYARRVRVAVAGDEVVLARLNTALWTEVSGDFVPHVWLKPGEEVSATMRRTPVWLLADPQWAPSCQMLINLRLQPADVPDGFERVIELVGDDADETQAGRLRWRRHEARGALPVHRSVRGLPAAMGAP